MDAVGEEGSPSMDSKGSPSMDSKGSRTIPIFIDTNIDTHLALSVSPSETVGDLREKVRNGHLSCFPHLRDIDIRALMVKRKSLFYHLVDSMLVESAFHGLKGNRFLRAEISQPNLQTVQEGPRPDVMELENGRVLNMHHLLGLPANETSPQKKGSGNPVTMSISDSFVYWKPSPLASQVIDTTKTCNLGLEQGKVSSKDGHLHSVTMQDPISQTMQNTEVSALAAAKTGKNVEVRINSSPVLIDNTDKQTRSSKSFRRSESPDRFSGECHQMVSDEQTRKSAKQEKGKSVAECSSMQDVCGHFSNNMQYPDAIKLGKETALRDEVVANEFETLDREDVTFETLKNFQSCEVQGHGNASDMQIGESTKQEKCKSVIECSPGQEGCVDLINNTHCEDMITMEEDKSFQNERIAKESENLCSGDETFVSSRKEKSKKKRKKEPHALSEGLSEQILPRIVEVSKKKRKRKQVYHIANHSSEQVLGKTETERDFLRQEGSGLEVVNVLKSTKENNDTNVKKTLEVPSDKHQKLLGSEAEDDHVPGGYLRLGKKQKNSSRDSAGKDSKDLQLKGDGKECNVEKRVKLRSKKSSKSAITDDDQKVSATDANDDPNISKHRYILESNCGKGEETMGGSMVLEENTEVKDAVCAPLKHLDVLSEKENLGQVKTIGKKKKKHSRSGLLEANSPEGIVREDVSKSDIIRNSHKDAGRENAPEVQNINKTNVLNGNAAVPNQSVQKLKANMDGNMDSRGTVIMEHHVSPGTAIQQPSEKQATVETRTPGLWDNENKKLKRSRKSLPGNETIKDTSTEKNVIKGSDFKPDRSIEKMQSDMNVSLKMPLFVSTELEKHPSSDLGCNIGARENISGLENEQYICEDSIPGDGNIEKCDDEGKQVKYPKSGISQSSQFRTVNSENGVMDTERRKLKRSRKGLPSNETIKGTSVKKMAVEVSASKPDRTIEKMDNDMEVLPKTPVCVSTELEKHPLSDLGYNIEAGGSVSVLKKEQHIYEDGITGNGIIEKCDDDNEEVKYAKVGTSKSSQFRSVSTENVVVDNESRKLKRSRRSKPDNKTIKGASTEKMVVKGSASKPDRSIENMESDISIPPKIPLPVSTELEKHSASDLDHNVEAGGNTSGVAKERYIRDDSIDRNGHIEQCDDENKEVKYSNCVTSKGSQFRALSTDNGIMDKVVAKAGNSSHHGDKITKESKNVNAGIFHKQKQVGSCAAHDSSDTSRSSKHLQCNDYSVKKHQSADQNIAQGRNSLADIENKIKHTDNSDTTAGFASDTINTSLLSRPMQNTENGAPRLQPADVNIVQRSVDLMDSTASDCSHMSKSSEERQVYASLTGKFESENQPDSPGRNTIENKLKQAESSATSDSSDTSQPAEKQTHAFATQKPQHKQEGLDTAKSTARTCHRQVQALGTVAADGSGNSQSSEEHDGSACAIEKPHYAREIHKGFSVNKAKSKDTLSERLKKHPGRSDDSKNGKRNRLSLFKSISDESTEEEDNANDYTGTSSSESFTDDSSDTLNSDAGSSDKASKGQSIKTHADWEPSTSGAPLSTALGKKQRDSGGSDPIQSKFAHLITKKTGLGELFKIAREQQKVDREKLDQFMATESPSVDIVLETQESQIELVHPEQNNEQEAAASPPSGTMNGGDKLLKDSPANAITATKSCPDINPNSSGKHNSCSLVQNPVHSSVQLKTADNGIPHVKQIEPNFKKAAKIEPQTNSSGKRKRAR